MTSKDHKRGLLPLDHFDVEFIPRHRDPSLRDREIPAPGEGTDDEGVDEDEE